MALLCYTKYLLFLVEFISLNSVFSIFRESNLFESKNEVEVEGVCLLCESIKIEINKLGYSLISFFIYKLYKN